jgi:predicted amidohydrolase
MRNVRVAAAQLGPIQKDDSRQVVVARMVELMDQAAAQKADLIVYPELALTTFFPRWHYEDRAEADFWFEREMPNAATRPLFERAAEHQVAVLRLCRAHPGRAPLQHLDPGRSRRRHRRQVPQGASARA